jgi:hypothetical protein
MDPNELTPQTAPRDVAALAACTPYQLRRLAETHLAGLRNEQEKMAWFGLKTAESKAQYILELLKRWDVQNGGASHANGAAAPAIPATPDMVRAPVTSAPSVAVQSMQPAAPNGAVNMPTNSAPAAAGAGPGPGFIPSITPSAVAAAAAATGEKGKATRTPRTGSAPVDLGADVVNLLNRILEGQEKAAKSYEDTARQVTNALSVEETGNTKRLEKLEGDLLVIQRQLTALTTLLQNAQQAQIWALMILASTQPNASPLEVLRSAVQDSESFPELVAQARGKA